MTKKYQIPEFLVGTLDQNKYQRWLSRKAVAHIKRDRARGNESAMRELYMIAIHGAVIRSKGKDEYTGILLRWDLISTYNNEGSKAGRREYKKSLADLPTVDHVGDGLGAPDFKICSWCVNGAKGDMSLDEFVNLCKKIVKYNQN